MQATEPPIPDPITKRTQAIVKELNHLQDVTKELREIRRLLEIDHEQKQGFKAAIKRAINQLFSQW